MLLYFMIYKCWQQFHTQVLLHHFYVFLLVFLAEVFYVFHSDSLKRKSLELKLMSFFPSDSPAVMLFPPTEWAAVLSIAF